MESKQTDVGYEPALGEASLGLSLFFPIKFVQHVVVAFATLLPPMVQVVWIAEHLVNFHPTAPIPRRAGRPRLHWGRSPVFRRGGYSCEWP